MTATASRPIHLGVQPLVAGDERPRAAGRRATVDITRSDRPGRWRTALEDVAILLAVIVSVPIVVLVSGSPLALGLAGLVWVGKSILGAF